jgi:hypothetical protein
MMMNEEEDIYMNSPLKRDNSKIRDEAELKKELFRMQHTQSKAYESDDEPAPDSESNF